MPNTVLKNNTSVTLDWGGIGADFYHVQVSLFPDFSLLLVDQPAVLGSGYAFTDGGTNNARRYWRFRSSFDAGATFGEWSPVNSYWLSDSLGGDLTLTDNQCALIDPSDVDDLYLLPTYPLITIQPVTIPRLETRNRRGTLLTEYITTKTRIELDFNERRFMESEQAAALRRFDFEIKVFFFAMQQYDGANYVPNVWKVQFAEDPRFAPFVPGRSDFYSGSATFVEV